ncbi:MAG: hypothetical protein IJY39_08320 [Clostridia bacterium]|nr:hypothetical protein [Clostridia bacterium]
MKKEIYILDGISLTPDKPLEEAVRLAEKKLKSVGISADSCSLNLYKKSVDARRKDDVRLICAVSVTPRGSFSEKTAGRLKRLGARAVELDEIEVSYGSEGMSARPLVVGMGPAGMFCALILAEHGYRPIIIDRGDSVADRVAAMERFYTSHILDEDSNIQFGAGGAGTFSDGKLLTRINDPKCTYVLKTLARFGAPEEITMKAKPHIGTDILRSVVDNILRHIESLGGEVIYRCKLTSLDERSDGTVEAKTTKGSFSCSCAVLALGHSARDTYEMLLQNGYEMIPKPISVGVRIEHKRSHIEEALYGRFAGTPSLGAAEYALSDTKGDRGVYTFCMCPGGEVVAAASECGGVVVNGMSHFARDGVNSNSAVAVSVRVEDFESVNGSLVLGAIDFQRRIERRAFVAGGGDYRVPVQTVGDFMRGVAEKEPYEVMPTYMGGDHFKVAHMDDVLPDFVCDSLRYGLASFDKKIKGFAADGALLSGAETRTSSPLRILRGENMQALGKGSIYPCGEGAGYAGGITSAAVDGIKVALAIAARFKPFD